MHKTERRKKKRILRARQRRAMRESTAYGKQFGEALRSKATAFVSRSLHNSNIAVTELRSDNPEHGISARLVREDAYLVGYHLVDYLVHEYFGDERAAPITALKAKQTTLTCAGFDRCC